MLRRLVAVSVGVAAGEEADGPPLAPAETLDGFGQLATPPPAATAIPPALSAEAAASPRHPPGLYGPENGRRALNLSNRMAEPGGGAVHSGRARGADRRPRRSGRWRPG